MIMPATLITLFYVDGTHAIQELPIKYEIHNIGWDWGAPNIILESKIPLDLGKWYTNCGASRCSGLSRKIWCIYITLYYIPQKPPSSYFIGSSSQETRPIGVKEYPRLGGRWCSRTWDPRTSSLLTKHSWHDCFRQLAHCFGLARIESRCYWQRTGWSRRMNSIAYNQIN